MNILIFGSNGFIGSHIFEYFSKKYHAVGCDITYSAKKNFIKIQNLEDIKDSIANQNFDFCINCTGSANVGFSFQNPSLDFELNVSNIVKTLNLLKDNNPNCKFINFSSAAVYGNPKTLPVKVTQEQNPISPYGFHKFLSEQILKEYYAIFKLKTCSLRVFSAYGEGQKKLLMWDLYQKFKDSTSKNVELFGTGNETRDFIHIQDIIQQVELVMKNALFQGEVYNVANGEEISIKQVADAFKLVLNSNKSICFNGEERVGDPLRWSADIQVFKDWGYVQSLDLLSGIKNYIDWVHNA